MILHMPIASPPPRREREQIDGHTYERSAIEQWLETHNTSPATGLELDSKQLIPCHFIRSLIRESHEAGARAPQTQTSSAEGAGAGL